MEEEMKSSFWNLMAVVAGLLLTGCALHLDDSYQSNSAAHTGRVMGSDAEPARNSPRDDIATNPTNGILSDRLTNPIRQAPSNSVAQKLVEDGKADDLPEPPPPPEVDRIHASPGFGYQWIAGAWTWQGRWIWIKGRWELPPRSTAVWVPGRWGSWRGKPTWITGHWR
jgi:hypothetical protein